MGPGSGLTEHLGLQDWYTLDFTKIEFLVAFGMNPVIPIPQPYTGGPNGRRRLLQDSEAIEPASVNKDTSFPSDLSQNPGVQVSTEPLPRQPRSNIAFCPCPDNQKHRALAKPAEIQQCILPVPRQSAAQVISAGSQDGMSLIFMPVQEMKPMQGLVK